MQAVTRAERVSFGVGCGVAGSLGSWVTGWGWPQQKYRRAYILNTMSERAKIFHHGGSQAVRLPKSCRFPDDEHEVIARKVGRKVILEPADEWTQDFITALGAWPHEIERPASKPIGKLRDPFA